MHLSKQAVKFRWLESNFEVKFDDCLEVGVVIQNNSFYSILFFRIYNPFILTDQEKIFRQIHLHDEKERSVFR
jgi:hypothetical protein